MKIMIIIYFVEKCTEKHISSRKKVVQVFERKYMHTYISKYIMHR